MSIVVTGANRHDVTQVETVLKNRIRKPRGRAQQNLCADAGYSDEKSENIMRAYHYTPHIRPRGEEKTAILHGFKARHWIVEVVHSWFNRFRKLLVRYEKNKCCLRIVATTRSKYYHFQKIRCYLGIYSKE